MLLLAAGSLLLALTGCSDIRHPGVGRNAGGDLVVFVPACQLARTGSVTATIDAGSNEAGSWRVNVPPGTEDTWWVVGATRMGLDEQPQAPVTLADDARMSIHLETAGKRAWEITLAGRSVPQAGQVLGSREVTPIDQVDPDTFMEDQCGDRPVIAHPRTVAVIVLALGAVALAIGLAIVLRRRSAGSPHR